MKASETESRNYYVSASLMGWAYKMIPNFISTMTYYAENHIH